MNTITKWLVCCMLLLISVPVLAQNNQLYINYIQKYKNLAIQQMHKYHIPASITLAQGIYESSAGQGDLARRSNNHFGIKTGGTWKGPTTRHDDDMRGELFRVYRTVQESYEDHSLFLTTRSRYASLFKLKQTDYKGWAHGLKKAGYATNPQYAYRLIDLIEKYELYQYDKVNPKDVSDDDEFIPNEMEMHLPAITIAGSIAISSCNGVEFATAMPGDDVKSISKRYKIKSSKLLKFNDLYRGYKIQSGDRLYLAQKRKYASKEAGYIYKVQEGDSMHSISQLFGIRLKKLYKMNKMHMYDPMPEVGTIIRIR